MTKLLVITNAPLSVNNGFGNTFTNIFNGCGYEIANIYCKPGFPDTPVASIFFQITEKSIIKSFISSNPSGRIVAHNGPSNHSESSIRQKATRMRWQVMFWARDLVWATGKWKSKELDEFITSFNPDIIFLPIYGDFYLNKIGVYVHKLTNKPMLGYISDDNYTLRQFNLSPLYWIDRLYKRTFVKEAINNCEILYTITDTQRKEFNEFFGEKCKVLFKGGNFDEFKPKELRDGEKVKLIYTGNLNIGRWGTLAQIGNALNQEEAELDIYSATVLPEKDLAKLTANPAVHFKGSVPASEVKGIQKTADILIHVESFNLAERYKSRLSFSTKIVDYLESSRCILAVGWEETGGVEYLCNEGAAYVITEKAEIATKVKELLISKALIKKIARNGFECGKRNHQLSKIQESIKEDINSVITSYGE